VKSSGGVHEWLAPDGSKDISSTDIGGTIEMMIETMLLSRVKPVI
jgi:hypothetical protein